MAIRQIVTITIRQIVTAAIRQIVTGDTTNSKCDVICRVNSKLQLGPRGRVGRRQLDQLEHAAELQLDWLWYECQY